MDTKLRLALEEAVRHIQSLSGEELRKEIRQSESSPFAIAMDVITLETNYINPKPTRIVLFDTKSVQTTRRVDAKLHTPRSAFEDIVPKAPILNNNKNSQHFSRAA